MTARVVLTATFDVTGLSVDEVSALCGEISVQAESSEGHGPAELVSIIVTENEGGSADDED